MSIALTQYGQLLCSRWRWLVGGLLLALAATTAFLIFWPPLYRSEATVFVRTPGDVSLVEDGGDSYAQARAGTYAALADSTSVSSRVIADLGLDLEPETLSRRIEATHRRGTALIDFGVSAPSAAEAQRTATVLLAEYATTVRSLETVPGSLVPRAELVVVDPPGRAVRVVAWGVPVAAVLLGAALIGVVLGALGAVLRSILERPVSPGRPVGPARPVGDRQPIPNAETPPTAEVSTAPHVLVGSGVAVDAAPEDLAGGRHRRVDGR